MKLAQIVLPMEHHFRPAHIWLEYKLLTNWHGFIASPGERRWATDDASMEVAVYQTAMIHSDVIKLREIAAELARMTDQNVMIVTPNGNVEFIKPLKISS